MISNSDEIQNESHNHNGINSLRQ